MALTLEQLALASHAQRQAAEYERFLQEALSLYREMGDNFNLTRLLNQAGMIALEGANDATAQAFFVEAIRRALAAHGLVNIVDALAGLALLAMRQGDELFALTLAEAVLQHPASTQPAHNLAGQVQAELLARLPTDQVEAARWRAKATPLESLAAEVLKAKDGETSGSKQKSTP
jgi:hypothetical protein